MDVSAPRFFARRSHPQHPPQPPQRISAWLADVDDWDADDVEVFMVQVGRQERLVTEEELGQLSA